MQKISLSLNEKSNLIHEKLVITIGFFDGLHKIHEKILKKTKKIANKNNLSFAVLTFDHKIRDFLKNQDTKILSLNEKYDYIDDLYQPNYLLEIQVSNETIIMNYFDFMNYLKNILNVEKIIVGDNFLFGRNKKGNIKDLQDFFGIKNIYVVRGNKKYSSSNLKKLLLSGKEKKANKLSNILKNKN